MEQRGKTLAPKMLLLCMQMAIPCKRHTIHEQPQETHGNQNPRKPDSTKKSDPQTIHHSKAVHRRTQNLRSPYHANGKHHNGGTTSPGKKQKNIKQDESGTKYNTRRSTQSLPSDLHTFDHIQSPSDQPPKNHP